MTLIASHIKKHYRKELHPTLNDISLTLKPNTIYGLFGRNGIGKTTLINCIGNRLRPNKGDITLNNQSLWDSQKEMNRIFLSNTTPFLESSPSIKNMHRLLQALYPKFDNDLFEKMLRAFDLSKDKRYVSLSAGQTQLIQNCIALCVDADYIFLDEPVTTLDANNREQFYHFILAAYARRKRTIVIVTHLINEVANIIEEVILLQNDNTILQKSVETLLLHSRIVEGALQYVNDLITRHSSILLTRNDYTASAVLLDPNVDLTHLPLVIKPVDLQTLCIALTKEVHNE